MCADQHDVDELLLCGRAGGVLEPHVVEEGAQKELHHVERGVIEVGVEHHVANVAASHVGGLYQLWRKRRSRAHGRETDVRDNSKKERGKIARKKNARKKERATMTSIH